MAQFSSYPRVPFASLGQKTMAQSAPVVIASNQTAVPVSLSSVPLPTGAATEVTLAALSAKLPAAAALADAVANPTLTQIGNFQFSFNGTTWDRLRSASSANLAATSGLGALIASQPGGWSQTNRPAVNTQATTSKAAVASTRHVCTSIHAVLNSNAAAAAIIDVVLRDGATGAGTILWSTTLSIPATANAMASISLSGLNIVGGVNTAMTLEFSAAGGANTFETVSLTGFDIT